MAPLILPCPSCKERSWECGRLCPEATWIIPLACSLLQREGLCKRGLPELGCGPGECPVKSAGPGTGVVAMLQITLNLAPGHLCQHQSSSLGKPGMKEINFHIFHIKKKNPMCKKIAKKKVWALPCPWAAIILPPPRAGGSSLSFPFALLGREGNICMQE